MLSIDQLLPIWVFYAKESEAPIAVIPQFSHGVKTKNPTLL